MEYGVCNGIVGEHFTKQQQVVVESITCVILKYIYKRGTKSIYVRMPLHPHISYTSLYTLNTMFHKFGRRKKRKTRFIGHLLLKIQILDIS